MPELAKGGIVMPTPGGRIVRVGEAGEAEAVVPLSRLRGGLGGDTYNITVTGVVMGTTDQIVSQLADWVAQAKRRGTVSPNAF